MPFSNYIRSLRKQYKVSRNDWAVRSNISRVTLWRWETGTTIPRRHELENALASLNASENDRSVAFQKWNIARGGVIQRIPSACDFTVTHRGMLLKTLRMRKGISQCDAADMAGVPRSSLSKWERMVSWPSSDRIHDICFALRATEPEFIILSSDPVAEIHNLPSIDELECSVEKLEGRSQIDDEFAALTVCGQLSEYLEKDNVIARDLLARNYLTIAHTWLNMDRYNEAKDLIARATELAVEPSDLLSIRLALTQACVHRLEPQFERGETPLSAGTRALKTLEGILHHKDTAPDAWRTRIFGDIALSLSLVGRHEEAIRSNRHALVIALNGDEEWRMKRRQFEEQLILFSAERYKETILATPIERQNHSFHESAFGYNRGRALLALGDINGGTQEILHSAEIAHLYSMPAMINRTDIELDKLGMSSRVV